MEPTNQPDFQHGYSSGVEGVTPDAYEGYLSSQVNLDWLNERIAEKRATIEQIQGQLGEATVARKTAFAQLQEHLLQVSVAAKRVEGFQAEQDALLTERTELQQRRAKHTPEYSLLAGLLFLVAGVSFLAGDLIISHEIVAYALNIRNTTEAWAFAVGLAMVSILLKPAYDRLVEQPYQRDPVAHGRRYGRFKIGLAVFAMLTLAVLGWFRYEAYRTDQLKSAINKSIRQMQQSSLSADGDGTVAADPALLARIEKQLQQSSELNLTLVNSPWALLSFVLSGLLFALAGAVCLGIGLPVLSDFWFRWLQADWRLRRIRKRLRRVQQELEPAESTLAGHLTRKAVLEHELALTPDPAELTARQQALHVEIDDMLAECRLAQTDSRIANFTDGFQKGAVARRTLSEGEQQQVKTNYLSNQANAKAPRPTLPTAAPRPHEALRNLIAGELDRREE
ncbi:hypothetical protein F5984_10350 [Rudanella paleaurantiibacter]|uniref:LapA family protein n=1 Tax=Rudanella paleaurantiibacter TaxID=2614655 RepID=A0A7J5U0B9_9BACT|nr:hypothetical protein [Rudanella paleaurantiibacter]KAB7731196.1 hypothetical protein F5984_10350 [Rudanella paleaurantiibacter]